MRYTIPAPAVCFLICCAALAVCLSLSLPATWAAETDTLPANLSAYRNKSRVLLLFAPSAGDSRYKKQNELFAGKEDGLTERDLIRLNVFEGQGTALRKQYGVKKGEFRVILVGKDGHTAHSTNHPMTASDLFQRIDRMPMRRDEMRRRGR